VSYNWARFVRLERLEILPFDLGCARLAGDIGGALVRAGRPMGVVDVGLAATAIHLDRVLVSGNTAHFGYVREAGFDLKLENWRDDAG
jgi:predicted nucleic acid-binding protein